MTLHQSTHDICMGIMAAILAGRCRHVEQCRNAMVEHLCKLEKFGGCCLSASKSYKASSAL